MNQNSGHISSNSTVLSALIWLSASLTSSNEKSFEYSEVTGFILSGFRTILVDTVWAVSRRSQETSSIALAIPFGSIVVVQAFFSVGFTQLA